MTHRQFANQKALIAYAEQNGRVYLWEGTHTFAKRQRTFSPDQYELVEVRTSRGVMRAAMLFPKAILEAECAAPRFARRWLSSVSRLRAAREARKK